MKSQGGRIAGFAPAPPGNLEEKMNKLNQLTHGEHISRVSKKYFGGRQGQEAKSHAQQIKGFCPDTAGNPHAYCYKFKNPDPAAFYDFWFLKSILRDPTVGHTAITTIEVPAANRELIIAVSSLEYQVIEKSTYIKTMKSSYSNFGVVSVSRLKVKEFYEAFLSLQTGIEYELTRWSHEGELLEIRKGGASILPPLLPGNRALTSPVSDCSCMDLDLALSQVDLDSRNAGLTDVIAFPIVRPVFGDSGDKIIDFEIEEGDSVEAPLTRDKEGKPPGIYTALGQQGGSPSLNLLCKYLVKPDGEQKVLYLKYCSCYSYHEFYQYTIKKTKRSWFKKKTKLTTVIKEMRVSGINCAEQFYPF